MNVDSDKIMEVLTELANKLGVAVEYLWGVIVKQQLAVGISSLITGIIYLLIVVAIAKYSPKAIKHFAEKKKALEDSRVNKGIGGYNGCSGVSSVEEDLSGTASILITILSILAVVFLVMVAINCLSCGIKMVINPDYYAFQDVMRLLGK